MSGLDTTRRSLLAGAAAVGGAELMPYARSAPAMPLAPVEHNDAKLLALRPMWLRCAKAMAEASRLLEEAEGRYDSAPEPEVLHVRPEDRDLFGPYIGEEWDRPGLQSIRVITDPRRLANFKEQLASPVLTPRQHRRHARMRELVAGFAAWKAENDRRWFACGLDTVNMLWHHAAMEATEVRKQIANEPALTAAGMAFKTEVVVDCYSGEFEEELRYRIDAGNGSDESLAASIILDLCLGHASGKALA